MNRRKPFKLPKLLLTETHRKSQPSSLLVRFLLINPLILKKSSIQGADGNDTNDVPTTDDLGSLSLSLTGRSVYGIIQHHWEIHNGLLHAQSL